MYICIIASCGGWAKEYEISTPNALEAAAEYGCGDDIVTIYDEDGEKITEARWDTESGRYYRCAVGNIYDDVYYYLPDFLEEV